MRLNMSLEVECGVGYIKIWDNLILAPKKFLNKGS